MRGGGVDDARGLAGVAAQRIDHGDRSDSRIVMQTQNHHICLCHQCALGRIVFAQGRVYAQHLDARHGLQALAYLQASGTGFAVDKDFFHGLKKAFNAGKAGAPKAHA